MNSDEISPGKSYAHQSKKPFNALGVIQMGFLDIESRAFQAFEERLDLPAFAISLDSLFGVVKTDEDLIVGHSVACPEMGAYNVDHVTLEIIPAAGTGILTDLEMTYKMNDLYLTFGIAFGYLEILTDPEIVPESDAVKPAYPFLADKLPVSHKTVNTVLAEEPDESLHEFLSFSPFGIASLWHEPEEDREGYIAVSDTEHKDIYIEPAELPVGAVHAQHQVLFDGKKAENHSCDKIKVKDISRKESLYPSHIGIPADFCGHEASQFMEAHCLGYDKCMKQKRHKLYSGKVDTISEMFFQDRKDLVNFVPVLGGSKYHRKSGQTFL